MADELQTVAGGTVTFGQIAQLERAMRDAGTIELEVRHHFAKGVYARELRIPAGTVLTGEVHKFTNLNILSAGDISVLTETGIERVQAPFAIVSPPGTKRVAYAHTDCVWTTVHGTDKTDVDDIRAEFVTDSYAGYLEFCESLKLEK